jgi:hypothetical protein
VALCDVDLGGSPAFSALPPSIADEVAGSQVVEAVTLDLVEVAVSAGAQEGGFACRSTDRSGEGREAG